MSHDIASAIVLIDRGGQLLLAAKTASSNVSPRTPSWSVVGRSFESAQAAKGMLVAQRLSGALVFDSTLARVRRVGAEGLDRAQRAALSRMDECLEGGPPAPYREADAIAELESCVHGDYYCAGSLALAEAAVKALREGSPMPNPNDRAWIQIRKARFPLLASVSQHGLSAQAREWLQADPKRALEAGPFGVTPLHRLSGAYAFAPDMAVGVLASARALLALGADAGAVDVRGRTPLHALADSGAPSRELAADLAAFGAPVDARDAQGNTPLHIAAGRSRHGIVEELLALGADFGAVNEAGETALDLARRAHGATPVLAMLESAHIQAHLARARTEPKAPRRRSL